ncbi:glycosyltransferase family 2 protein [Flaviaesturariibacter terrae]
MKVIAIVVTYNRLALLKECIAALLVQTRRPDAILVVDNASTDGTGDWLATQPVETITQPNRGGSWGFYTGVKSAYAAGADWTWLMDDDTIPTAGALEALLAASSSTDRIGFLGSKATWTDGTPHLMNLPDIKTYTHGKPFNLYDAHGFFLVNASSFVSLLLSRAAVQEVGLPIKEYFIWNDDAEYTERITRAGFIGGYLPASVVLHKTPTNHFSDIFLDDVKGLWKYRYGIRNELHTYRMRKGKFWGRFFKRVFVIPFRILRKRKDHQWAFIKTNWQASFSAINFNPTIEKVS